MTYEQVWKLLVRIGYQIEHELIEHDGNHTPRLRQLYLRIVRVLRLTSYPEFTFVDIHGNVLTVYPEGAVVLKERTTAELDRPLTV